MFIKKILAFLDHFERYVCQILLAFFVTVLFIQIICRELHWPLTWSEEVARYAFLWFIMFGACYATRISALNRVTMHLNKISKPVATAILLLGDLLWVAFSLALAWYGYVNCKELFEFPYRTPALDWNLCYIDLIFPICFTLMAVRIIQVDICRYLLKMEIVDPDKASVEESKRTFMEDNRQNPTEEIPLPGKMKEERA